MGQGERAGAPTICVGNFVVGGAGKTPTALALARMLIGDDRRVAFLSRGYGGAERVEPLLVDAAAHNAAMVGDEPLLLARVAQCWVGTDRIRSARSAVEAGADTLILDDGLQNPGLVKDLSFAVVDGESGFGNGLCVPAGPLRAPLSAQLPFVQALIVLGGDDAAASRIAALAPGKPLLRASLEPDALAAAPLIGREVVAFAGIARPEKFYATLRRIGAQLVATHDFADHHRLHAARARGADRGSGPTRRASGDDRERPGATDRPSGPRRRDAAGHLAFRGAGVGQAHPAPGRGGVGFFLSSRARSNPRDHSSPRHCSEHAEAEANRALAHFIDKSRNLWHIILQRRKVDRGCSISRNFDLSPLLAASAHNL